MLNGGFREFFPFGEQEIGLSQRDTNFFCNYLRLQLGN